MFVTTGTNTQQISAPIILEPSLTEQKVANKIFISKNVHSNDDYIVNMQNQGASAVIVVTLSNTVAGYMRFRFMDKTKIQQIRIPVFEMVLPDYDDVEPLLLNNSVSTITLLPNDEPNPWDVVLLSPGQYIYQAILIAFSTTNIALAIWKIKLFVDFYSGYKTSISLTVLFLEIISNLRKSKKINLYDENSYENMPFILL
jgi:hypothetical protein